MNVLPNLGLSLYKAHYRTFFNITTSKLTKNLTDNQLTNKITKSIPNIQSNLTNNISSITKDINSISIPNYFKQLIPSDKNSNDESFIESFKNAIQNENFISSYKDYLHSAQKANTLWNENKETVELLKDIKMIVSASNTELTYGFLMLANDFASKGINPEEYDSTEFMLHLVHELVKHLNEENKLRKTIETVGKITTNLKESDCLKNLKDSTVNRFMKNSNE